MRLPSATCTRPASRNPTLQMYPEQELAECIRIVNDYEWAVIGGPDKKLTTSATFDS